ncbi:hypothetical protein IT575_06695 [bacterium]|nr:hypothetical protein [bacterium]
MDSRLEDALTHSMQSPEDLIAFGAELNVVFFKLMYACKVEEAWAVAARYGRLFREAPERFRADPWNTRLAFQLCLMESVGAYFMARLNMYERALQSSEKALDLVRLRFDYAAARGERPGWSQPRCYILGALGTVKWLKPELRDEVLEPAQILQEWDECLEAYAGHSNEILKQSQRTLMVLAFNSVMRSAVFHKVLSLEQYNEKALEARRVLLIDFPSYPPPDPDKLGLSMLHHYYYYDSCFMLEACSPEPCHRRLRGYMDLNFRTCKALGAAMGQPEMGDFVKRDCNNEYRVVLGRLGLKTGEAREMEELSLAS